MSWHHCSDWLRASVKRLMRKTVAQRGSLITLLKLWFKSIQIDLYSYSHILISYRNDFFSFEWIKNLVSCQSRYIQGYIDTWRNRFCVLFRNHINHIDDTDFAQLWNYPPYPSISGTLWRRCAGSVWRRCLCLVAFEDDILSGSVWWRQ